MIVALSEGGRTMDRRAFLAGMGMTAAAISGATVPAVTAFAGDPVLGMRDAAVARGFDIGACLSVPQLRNPKYEKLIRGSFTLAANLYSDVEWASHPGLHDDPSFFDYKAFLGRCDVLGLRPRIRQIYSHENTPPRAHLRADGTPQNKSELEKTLIRRVRQVCEPLRGRKATIQVVDEILADHEGGLRKCPFSNALGEGFVDILFHAAHEAAPDALLTYQEFGPENDPKHFFRRKTRDHLALLERLRKRKVPITGVALGGFSQPAYATGLVLDRNYFKRIQDMDYDIHINEMTVIYAICGSKKSWKPKPGDKTHDRVVESHYVNNFKFLTQLKRLKEIAFWAPFDGDNTVQTGTRCIIPFAGARPGIFDRDARPKKVYGSLVKITADSRPRI